ncbi:hypothetical protein ECP03047993_5386 [Escherichia coli P0304799.3]|nr:hypothetical protein ECP03047993_5386 [Escherichia coli P0304799.3]
MACLLTTRDSVIFFEYHQLINQKKDIHQTMAHHKGAIV